MSWPELWLFYKHPGILSPSEPILTCQYEGLTVEVLGSSSLPSL